MKTDTVPERMRWWIEARFGMFIHWGLYSMPGRGEWIMYQEHIPNEEYAKLAEQFRPRHFNARDWVSMAQDAGMRYMVLTTRHHDGFCLFDSQVSEFTAPKTAARRDFIAEYAEACHAARGARMGFYYSLEDWRFAGQLPHLPMKTDSEYEPMVEQAHAQVRELCSNYGKVDVLWYDGGFPSHVWRARELNAMVRSLQPDIIMDDRAGIPEDFGTPENVVIPQASPWEACYTMNDSWGYASGDLNYKTPATLLRLLASCVAQDGNFLLNVGPDAEGRFPSEAVTRLRAIGQWMRVNGEAPRGAGRGPIARDRAGFGLVHARGRQGLSAHSALAWGDSALRLVRQHGALRAPRNYGPGAHDRTTRRPRLAVRPSQGSPGPYSLSNHDKL